MTRYTVECWQCGGNGKIAGCFEDCCVCGNDDDPDFCCSPSRCDICKGKGHYVVTQLTEDNTDSAVPISE